MIDFDYHSHHHRCGHALGTMSDYIDAAIGRGMTTFGVSDHGPAYWVPGVDHAYPQTQMAITTLPDYVTEARKLQKDYAEKIDVRVGIEADFIEGQTPLLRSWLAENEFDYVLGSVHYALGKSVFDRNRWKQEPAEAVWRAYYALVIEAAESGLFDILSHLTVVEAYSPPMPDAIAREIYPSVADAVANAGCVVEVNTSGYRKMGGDDPFPNRRMLRLLIERGVPLTFGSDCHRPEEVGFGRSRVSDLLVEMGVSTSETFEWSGKRRPVRVFRTG